MTTTPVAVPSVVVRPSPAGVVLAVARVEAVRLVLHPAFIVGLAGTVAVQVGRAGADDWAGEGYYRGMAFWTFLWVGTLVAAALVAGRQRLLCDVDVFPVTPATNGDRALGTALGLLGPVAAATAAVCVVAAVTASGGGYIHGSGAYAQAIHPSLIEWAQPIVLVALAGVLGIGLAQLRRRRFAALLAAGVILFFGGTGVWVFRAHPLRVLDPFMYPSYDRRLPDSFDPAGWTAGDRPLLAPDQYTSFWREVRFDPTALGWHLVYIGGLVLLDVWVVVRLADRTESAATLRYLVYAGVPLLLAGGVGQIITAGVP